MSSFNHCPCRSLSNMSQDTGISFTATASTSSNLRFPRTRVLTSLVKLWTAISNAPFGIGSCAERTVLVYSVSGDSDHLPNPTQRLREGPGALWAIRASLGIARCTRCGDQVALHRPTAPAVDRGFGAVASVSGPPECSRSTRRAVPRASWCTPYTQVFRPWRVFRHEETYQILGLKSIPRPSSLTSSLTSFVLNF